MSESGGLTVPSVLAGANAGQVVASSGNVAAAAAVATINGAAGKPVWISGFEVTAAGSTAGAVVVVTVTGPPATLNYIFVFPAGAAVQATPLVVEFNPPIQSVNDVTPITVTCPSGGAGNTNAAVNAHGYRF